MTTMNKPVVAISSDFMNAFAAIPKQQQNKVLDFITKFRMNPTAKSIHYEKIAQFKDDSLRSVRIDQTYRGIVKKPEAGNVYMLLWVDHHDRAYEWAKNKKCIINPETGGLQVYDVDSATTVKAEPRSDEAGQKETCLFAGIHDRHLIRLGVPEDLLPLVRNIFSDEQLDRAARQLPVEAHEALTALAAGYTLDEVLAEGNRIIGKDEQVDTSDFQKALENPHPKRRFVVVDDDIALEEILEAPLEKWRVFLHPSQRSLVERDRNGPVRVLGGAGTGKTVVAMHRAKYLVEKVFVEEHDRILLTTFTRNLAADIKENLAKICPDKLMRRIEVTNLDRWTLSFLRKNNYNYDIDYGERTKPLWEKALSLAPSEPGLGDSFYREEWERVIQPQEITTFAEYLKATRVGRGVRLSRQDRKAIWPVFEEYRLLLNENRLREADDAMRDARALIREKGDILPYRAVIVDEAQDMGPQAFKLIREMAGAERKNDIFIVGDAHQRIYRHKVVLGRCGIRIVGRSSKLRINYRTTEENRRWAVSLLEDIPFDDLDGGLDSQKGYTSLLHGTEPSIQQFASFQEEIECIATNLDRIRQESGSLQEVCLVARTHELLRQYEGALQAKGLATCLIRRSEAEDRRKEGLRLATMHRVKGLEFDRVIIARVNDGIVPFEDAVDSSSDMAIQTELDIQEKALLYVAATRAKKEVLVTSFGKRSRFLY